MYMLPACHIVFMRRSGLQMLAYCCAAWLSHPLPLPAVLCLATLLAAVLQELVNLSAEEMASDEKRQQNAKIRQEVAADLVRGQTQQASTDMFK